MVSTRRRVGPRSLGQNFLVDRNIIDVIARLAELAPDDVVLEVGGGEGILSARLAADTSFLHLIEIDRSLEPGLREALASAENWALHLGDAVDYPLGELVPAPTKMVANLPYSVAATVILRTVFELPTITSWVVMVQREVGERFAAAPGSGTYGVPSVLAQLACDVRVLRPISRSVFRPVPNVDSVLLGLSRHAGLVASMPVRTLVHDAFAHRRKALAGSLALAAGAQPGIRERARAALEELGFPADVRAERLAPADFVALSERLAA
jgi:16S rRNA (adenine1518-N6/adenine1519-N6)-dimethyltransferase